MIVAPSPERLAEAATLLRSGALVAFPTETVYGLGADASNAEAVRKLFRLKGRPPTHPVIVHLRNASQLSRWAEYVPEAAQKLADAFWPGPLSVIVPRAATVPLEVTGGQDTVAVRVPSHPVARALLDAFEGGIAAPSANRFGRVSPTEAAHVWAEFGEDVPRILDGGRSDFGIESAVVDASGREPAVLRPGSIGIDAIAACLGRPIAAPAQNATRAPGTLPKHYAPSVPLSILAASGIDSKTKRRERVAWLVWSEPARQALLGEALLWAMPSEAEAYARAVYRTLREAERSGAEAIVAEQVPDGLTWAAVRDRLERAAAG